MVMIQRQLGNPQVFGTIWVTAVSKVLAVLWNKSELN